MARCTRDERGAAAVETALCLCFVVLPLIFAVIGYAFLLSFRQSLSQAAAEGARAAAVAPAGATDRLARAQGAVEQALQGLVGTHTCGDGTLTCSITGAGAAKVPCPNDASAYCVTVTLSYPYRDNPLLPSVPLLGFVYPSDVSYSAVAEVS